jgi:signal transduction histidine kinase
MIPEDDARLNQPAIDAALRIIADGTHEIRNQLSVLLLGLGKISHPDARALEGDVQTASESVNRVAILFKLAIAETLARKSFDLEDAIRDLVRRAECGRPDRLHRIDTGQSTISAFHGNAAFITEAVRGLLDNAVRHTSETSRIMVSLNRAGSITIDDDGPGLPPEVTRRFGEPFVHGREPACGMGLGFAVAHHVARLHGGRCHLAPSRLGGTCVRLDLTSGSARADPHE